MATPEKIGGLKEVIACFLVASLVSASIPAISIANPRVEIRVPEAQSTMGVSAWGQYFHNNPNLMGALGLSSTLAPSLQHVMDATSFAPKQIANLSVEEQAQWVRRRVQRQAYEAVSKPVDLNPYSEHGAGSRLPILEKQERQLRYLRDLAALAPDIQQRLIDSHDTVQSQLKEIRTKQEERTLSPIKHVKWEGGDKEGGGFITARPLGGRVRRNQLKKAGDLSLPPGDAEGRGNKVPSPPTEGDRTIETMISLDYRKFAWGMERVVLDSISNHLPADSGGTKATVRLLQDGRWVNLDQADELKPTEAIVFEDDGKGYDVGLLSILYSTKQDDPQSVGQFGEGLKLVAAAALRLGIDFQYQSKNWTAVPVRQEVQVGERSIAKLGFRINESRTAVHGSRTIFSNPPQSLVEEVLRLPEKVLAFNQKYKELYRYRRLDYTRMFRVLELPDLLKEALAVKLKDGTEHDNPFFQPKDLEVETKPEKKSAPAVGDAADDGPYFSRILDLGDASKQAIFVKGVRAAGMREPSIFSYDLVTERIAPDRQVVDSESMMSEIESLLAGTDSEEVIGKILAQAKLNPRGHYYEFSAIGAAKRRRQAQGYGSGMMHRMDSMDSLFDSTFSRPETVPAFSNPWVATFLKLFGENAVLASRDTTSGTNVDAQMMGYTPIELPYSIWEHLQKLGVPTADKIAVGEKEVRWVAESDLTESEKAILATVDEINKIVLGHAIPDPVRVFAGIFLASGREYAPTDSYGKAREIGQEDMHEMLGVQEAAADGHKIIGIRRGNLQNFSDFARIYIHELGHYITGKGDYDREFTDFFVRALAKLMAHFVQAPPSTGASLVLERAAFRAEP